MPAAALHRLRAEADGFALASAIMILAIVLIVGAIGAKVAISAVHGTSRDRSSAEAFEAADSAVDIMNWRMNRLLVANEVGTLTSFTTNTLQTLGCVTEDAAGDLVPGLDGADGNSDGLCTMDILGLGNDADVSCATTVATDLSVPGVLQDLPNATEKLLIRPVVCTATVNGVTRRIYARMGLRVKVNGLADTVTAPLSLWRRYAWEECPSDESDPCPPTSS